MANNSNGDGSDTSVSRTIDLSVFKKPSRTKLRTLVTKKTSFDIETEIEKFLFSPSQSTKKISEVYLGYEELEWFYTKANYVATCTEAIDFTLFDKTICALLQIEGHLSLEQIGETLGFNVINDPSRNKYKDLAEYEILKEALQSLQEFEMIDGGDIDFSHCALTSIGKEYVSKGKKFKTYSNKKFELYFDCTSNQHSNSKSNFEFIKGISVDNNDCEIDYEDERFLKTFAKSQIPRIYNPEELSSFKEAKCLEKNHFKAIYYRIYLLDISNGKTRSLIFDPNDKTVNENISEYDCQRINHQILMDFVNSKYQILDFKNEHNEDFKNLIDYQEILNNALAEESSEKAISILDNYYADCLYTENEMFFCNLSKFLESSVQEIWFMLKDLSNIELEAIKNCIITHKEKYFFIYLEKVDLSQQLFDLINREEEKFQNTYILLVDSVAEFNVLFKSDSKIWNDIKQDTLTIPISINENLHQITKPMLYRNLTELDIDEKYLNQYRLSFAKEYVPTVDKYIKQFFNELNTQDETSLDRITEILSIDKKLLPFKSLGNSKNYFQKLEKQKHLAVNSIRKNRSKKISSDLDKLFKKINDNTNPTIKFLEKIENQIKKQKEQCLEEESPLFKEIELKLKTLKKDIEISSQRKSIIIDTNILLEEPNIIKIIGQQQTIIFSGKVIDELDNLKLKPKLKEKAQSAIRNIHKHRQEKNIRFNTSKIYNLPSDFNKNSPDNIILSVALQYMKRNPVILTNDKGMSIKAKILGIPAKDINELKNILEMKKSSRPNSKVRSNKKRK